MNTELPDDMAAWPADHFDLLGIRRGTKDDEIRRAYTRLIRKFKPEHFPAQFQRIREAYEACRYQSAWYRHSIDDRETKSEAPSEPVVIQPEWPRTPSAEQPPDPVELLWQEAIEGDLTDAYDGLKRQRQQTDRSDLPLRLYWLLATNPAIDSERTRHDWLADALIQSRLTGSAAELYRRELERDPQTALHGPYADLLLAEARRDDLLAIARARCNAAGRSGRFKTLEQDLKRMKTRIGIDSELAWLALVTSAIEWSALELQPSLDVTCLEELLALEHLALHQSYYFDRVEESEVWRDFDRQAKRSGLPQEFVQFIHAGWCSHGQIPRDALHTAVAAIVADPRTSLQRLDNFVQNAGSDFCRYAIQILRRYQPEPSDAMPGTLVRGMVRTIPLTGLLYNFHDARLQTLEWLVRDGIHPEELAEACALDPVATYRTHAERIRSDLNLQVIWLACSVR